MPTFAVTSVGQDRPGIVAAVTRQLLDAGCNLEDTAMTILRGQFAMVMVVDVPPGVTPEDLEAALGERTRDLELVVSVREVHPAAGVVDVFGSRCTVVAYGPDHPGIVNHVAEALAARGVNIVDVATRVSGADGALYSMVMEVVLPAGLDPEELERQLAETAARDDLTIRVSPVDADLF